ncbi:MAG: isopeptide-forming domain-containing fimbrial protein, partial [Usitatibacteraceae bacterium]
SVITLTANIAANAPASITNTAAVQVSGESNSGNNSAASVISVAAVAPDLTLTKVAQGSGFQQGGTVTYFITVSNSGNGSTSGTITMQDTIPTGLTVTSVSGTNWTCTNAATVSCTRTLALAAGTSSVITLTANIAANAPASITNTAAVQVSGESNSGNNSGASVISVGAAAPDLTLTKTSPSTFVQGGAASYTLAVSNIGTLPTTAAYAVTDAMPTGLTAGTPTGAGWNCAASTSTVVSCSNSTVLAPGASAVLSIPVTIAGTAPASITNTATVTGGGESNTGNNAASVTVAVASQPVPVLVSVVSSKLHNGVNYDFTIDHTQLIDGAISIEPRTGSSGHTLVFHFDIPVTSVDALPSVTDAGGNPVGNASASVVGGDVVVALLNIPDRQRVTVTISALNGIPTATAKSALGYMLGDFNGTRSVNSSDISGVKARSGQTTNALNFMFDLNATGAINSSDISAVKARSGTSLP